MTLTQLRVPVASVQGTLALDLGPRHAPPPLPGPSPSGPVSDVVRMDPRQRERLERWMHRYAQAAVEIVGGDRPAAQLVRWTTQEVYLDLQRRAVLVARAGGQPPGVQRIQPVRPQVASVHVSLVGPRVAEASARVRYGARSRALALRFEQKPDRWVCTAMEFA